MSDAEFSKKLIKDPNNIVYVSLSHLSLTLLHHIFFFTFFHHILINNFTLITQKNVETGLDFFVCLYLNMLLLFLSVMLASYLTFFIVRKWKEPIKIIRVLVKLDKLCIFSCVFFVYVFKCEIFIILFFMTMSRE
jgi:hypothetical protein